MDSQVLLGAKRLTLRLLWRIVMAMCELCEERIFSIEKLEPEEVREEGLVCEWMPKARGGEPLVEQVDENGESGEEMCGADAVYSVLEEYVIEHLCDEHARQQERDYEEGLGEFLSASGFDKGELVPIRNTEDCEYFDPRGREDSCPRAARFARRVREEFLYCEEHARLDGYLH